MQNYDDRIVLDEELEVEYQQPSIVNEPTKFEATNYSNRNVATNNFFEIAFSKKYLALTLASLSILFTLFFKFLIVCGVTSSAFMGIWFFINASLSGTSLVLNILSYIKTRKVEFNVSTILMLISLLGLLLI